MKRKLIALLLAAAVALMLCVTAFAVGEDVTEVPFSEESEDSVFVSPAPEMPGVYEEDADTFANGDDEYFNFGDEYGDFGEYDYDEAYEAAAEVAENSEKIAFTFGLVVLISALVFLPSLILTIVFGVQNSKLKKKIKQYEETFKIKPQFAVPTNSAQLNSQQNKAPQASFANGAQQSYQPYGQSQYTPPVQPQNTFNAAPAQPAYGNTTAQQNAYAQQPYAAPVQQNTYAAPAQPEGYAQPAQNTYAQPAAQSFYATPAQQETFGTNPQEQPFGFNNGNGGTQGGQM